jgi:hypothetical protein
VNLDVTHHELLRLEQAPDVLVLPSRLKHFSKVRRGWNARAGAGADGADCRLDARHQSGLPIARAHGGDV